MYTQRRIRGNGGAAPHIFKLGTIWKTVVNFKTRLLYLQGKSSLYRGNRRMGGLQSRSGIFEEAMHLLPLPEVEIGFHGSLFRYLIKCIKLLAV
jgi:hypothetical protein